MSEWFAMEAWARCQEMVRPGYVFELRNSEGLSMFTPCLPSPLPAPVGWKSPPSEFRLVAEAPAVHSSPLPPPRPK